MIIFEQIFKMKKYILFIAMSAVAIIAQAQSLEVKTFKVILDRGHDAVDKGVQVGDETEYQILSDLVQQLTGEIQNNVEVVYHNPTGERLTIEERAIQINALDPDLVISFHMGASRNGPRQAAVLMNEENKGFEKSKEFASLLITHLSNDPYFSTILTETTAMSLLNKVNAPAFALEIGNMNAPRDRYYLQTNGAKRVAKNFTDFLNALN